jgi:glycogen(starch) synthase
LAKFIIEAQVIMSKKLRVLYAAGPGNTIGTYGYWIKGEEDPSITAITYSAQFYDVCSTLDAEGYLIASPIDDRQCFRDGRFTIEHRPVPFRNGPGILYHLGQVWYGLNLIVSALRFKADVVIVVEGSTHLFLMSILPWLGIKVVPLLQCVLWPKYETPSLVNRLIWGLSRNLFRRDCFATVVVSEDIAEQVKEISGDNHQPILRIVPNYRRSLFADIAPPRKDHTPFQVLFAGRIEPNKGVFDILEIAKRFASENRQNIRFDVCGKGSALDSLRQAAKEAGVDSFFVCHGYCKKPQMRQFLGQSHVVIVPTRTDFIEGFNKVVVEGVLSGRPVITSSVCPAISLVKDAIVEVAPNDVEAYGNAIINLCEDRKLYEEKSTACIELQEKFYDTSQGWGAALKSILLAVKNDEMLDR